MRKLIITFDRHGQRINSDSVEADPVCGEDFCDSCGDCLVCYYDDECYGNDSGCHLWVEYVYPETIVEINRNAV